MEDISTLIIDNGTYAVKSGFSGGKGPRGVTPNIIGRSLDAGADPNQYLVGDQLLQRRGLNYSKEYPMEKGVVVNWDLMEKVWHHTFETDLRCDPQEHAFIVTNSTFAPKSQKEKIAEIMFETFNSPALRIIDQAVSGLAFLFENTGLVVDMGYESTRVVPVYQGHALAHHGIELNYGGKDLTDYMQQLCPSFPRNCIEDLKEKMCYVASDFEEEAAKAQKDPSSVTKLYELPDGTEHFAGEERFLCPEALFNPSLIHKADQGLHQAVVQVLKNVDPSIRTALMKRILLVGRPSYTINIATRLFTEVVRLWPEDESSFNVTAPPGSFMAPYYGASYLEEQRYGNDMKFFYQSFVEKSEWDDEGSKRIHRMFY